MANYTPNYGLHQWEPEDNFLRTDFNQDFAKIDAAIQGVADTADAKKADKSALAEVKGLAEGKCRVIPGRLVGDGEEYQDIPLGARPKAVFLSWGASTYLAVESANNFGLSLTDNGFRVGRSNSSSDRFFNKSGQSLYYLAVM